MTRMAPVDARTHWLSRVIPNDQFLVYCFADQGDPLGSLAQHLLRRAEDIPDLGLSVLDVPGVLDYPLWVGCPITDDQFVIHGAVGTWDGCLERIAALTGDQLDPTRHAWRLHLLGPVSDGPCGAGVVVVLQISHALGDGRRVSRIARELFGGVPIGGPHPRSAARFAPPRQAMGAATAAWGLVSMPMHVGQMLWHGATAFRAVRDRPRAPGAGYAPTVLNRQPGPDRVLRVVVVDRARFPSGHTVTVGALTVISFALAAYLGGGPADPIGAELTVGGNRPSRSRNNFRNVGIDLHCDIADPGTRARAIADEVARVRAADDDPVRRAERAADDATPAVLAYWGTRQFDPTRRPDRVTGVTVVSSVYRGPADLELAGAPILFSTGFPALSPMQGLTHGVHGTGETIALSITTSPEIMPDVDRYVRLLDDAFDRLKAIGAAQRSSDSPRE